VARSDVRRNPARSGFESADRCQQGRRSIGRNRKEETTIREHISARKAKEEIPIQLFVIRVENSCRFSGFVIENDDGKNFGQIPA
jgi:hypothetical protein